MYQQICVDIFLKYSTPLPSSFAAAERLFSMAAAIFATKQTSLTSKQLSTAYFSEKKLDFLKWQGVAQDNFNDCQVRLVNK